VAKVAEKAGRLEVANKVNAMQCNAMEDRVYRLGKSRGITKPLEERIVQFAKEEEGTTSRIRDGKRGQTRPKVIWHEAQLG
jgi:hypothetical protein